MTTTTTIISDIRRICRCADGFGDMVALARPGVAGGALGED